jgi:hypothetical protein
MPSPKCVEEHRARGAMIWICGVALIVAMIIVSI